MDSIPTTPTATLSTPKASSMPATPKASPEGRFASSSTLEELMLDATEATIPEEALLLTSSQVDDLLGPIGPISTEVSAETSLVQETQASAQAFAQASAQASALVDSSNIMNMMATFGRQQELVCAKRAEELLAFTERIQHDMSITQQGIKIVAKKLDDKVVNVENKVVELQTAVNKLATIDQVNAIALVLSNRVFSVLRNKPIAKTLIRFVLRYGFNTVSGYTCVVFHHFNDALHLCISIRALSALMRFMAPGERLGWSKQEWRQRATLDSLLRELGPLEAVDKDATTLRAVNDKSNCVEYAKRTSLAMMKKEWICIHAAELVESVQQFAQSAASEQWLQFDQT